jgi:hypothetical protein
MIGRVKHSVENTIKLESPKCQLCTKIFYCVLLLCTLTLGSFYCAKYNNVRKIQKAYDKYCKTNPGCPDVTVYDTIFLNSTKINWSDPGLA